MQDPLFIPIATLLTASLEGPLRSIANSVLVFYVEIKAVREVEDIHLAVVLAYLKATRLVAGLILNFSEAKLRIRRVVRSTGLTAEAPKSR